MLFHYVMSDNTLSKTSRWVSQFELADYMMYRVTRSRDLFPHHFLLSHEWSEGFSRDTLHDAYARK